MNDNQYDGQYEGDENITIGLSADDIRAVAKRQFVASIAVAAVIAIGAGLAALMPATLTVASQNVTSVAATRSIAQVQQPTFVTPLAHRLASAKTREIELP
jgi:hypothetical protein